MQQISLFLNTTTKESVYKNRRDQLIKEAVIHINDLRVGTPYEKIKETPANLAKRINMNPFLKGKNNDGELELLLRQCKEKNNYGLLYKTLNNKR